jgi:hypothetical protein
MSSEKGIFSIYYGEGNVIYGPNGVNLSEFNCAVRGITRPHERNSSSAGVPISGREVPIF